MNKLIEYFVKRSLLVNMVTFIVVIVGLMAIFNLQKEVFPMVDFETIIVRANYPGASAEDMEKLVTIPMEREIKEVDGIEEMNAMSGEGYSLVVIKVDPDYATDDVLEDTRNAVDTITDFPEDVERPYIDKIVNKLRPIIQIALKGDDEWYLRELAKDFRDEVERLKGIAKVTFDGYREERVDVAVDPQKLIQYELTMADVSMAIRDRNTNIAGGTIKKTPKEVIVRTMNEFEGPADVKRVVVRSNASGSNVKVSDIATVDRVLKDTDVRLSTDGKLSVVLRVVAKSSADVIQTTENVKQFTEKYLSRFKSKGISFQYMDEAAFWVKRRLSILTQNGLQGMVLVFLCLLAFMNFSVSFMTSLGAPLAFLVSFALMEYFGISINMISMFGLILVLGMLVDDSIIVAENFYQKLEKGEEPEEAAKVAAKETVAPVTATILTTMVAFGALFFMSGIMGKFLWSVPAVVIICLLASWLECFFILPSHLAEFVKISKGGMEKTKWYQPLLNNYEKNLRRFLNWKYATVIGFFLIFVSAIVVFRTMKLELFPADDVQIVWVKLKGPVGTPVKETKEAVSKIENIILSELKEDELEAVNAMVSTQRSNHGSSKIGSHYGMLSVYLTGQDFRKRKTEELIDLISKKSKAAVTNFDISIDLKVGGPPQGKPVNIEISGDSIKDLKVYSKKIEQMLKKEKGVLITEIDYEEGKQQYIVKVDEEEARRLGLTNTQIAMEVRRAYEGEVSTEIRRNDEDIDVVVRLDEQSRSTDDTLDNLYITNTFQRRIKLTQVAKIVKEPGSFVIRRYNRKRTFAIMAEIDRKRGANAVLINKSVAPKVKEILKDTGLDYQLTGSNKDTKESMANFKRAAIVSMILIFIILVAMFSSFGQPLIIMSAIPLGLIGVVYIFKIFGMPISFMALMGIIGLVGVVVNDSIVLVNFINIKIQESSNVFESIVEACMSRFRPVILTTFTTVAGLLPVAHMPGGDPFLKPMAISFAYGLIFSTSLTLVFVPCAYYIYELLLEKFGKGKAMKLDTSGQDESTATLASN